MGVSSITRVYHSQIRYTQTDLVRNESTNRRGVSGFHHHRKIVGLVTGEITIRHRQADKTGPKGESIPGDRPASINRTTQALSQCFTLAIRRGHLTRALQIRKLNEDNVREGFFDEAEARAVIGYLPDDGLRDFVLFGYICGWRKGSIAKLRWPAVDLEAGEILLPGKFVKNRKPLKMAIGGELRELLRTAGSGA